MKKILKFKKVWCKKVLLRGILLALLCCGCFLCGDLAYYFYDSNFKENKIDVRVKDFDVDLVYLWCDGEDPSFAARKNEWLRKEGKKNSKAAMADGRFVQVN